MPNKKRPNDNTLHRRESIDLLETVLVSKDRFVFVFELVFIVSPVLIANNSMGTIRPNVKDKFDLLFRG